MNFKCQSVSQNSELGSLFLYLRYISVILMVILLAACEQQTIRNTVTFSGPTMGTEYRIKIVLGGQHSIAKEYLNSMELRIQQQMDKVDVSMSTYKPDSEISQFNKLGANTPLSLSPIATQVIEEALAISKQTGGAFDITVAKAVNLWGFGPDGRIEQRPDPQQLAKLKLGVGFQNVNLKGTQISKSNPATAIDLSAIAKGFAIDQLARIFQSMQINDYLINVGGELRAGGRNADGHLWSVAIEKPQVLGGVQETIQLNDAAIATSGDYRNYVEIDGQQYSHLIDPQTLQPIHHKLASVSVVSEHASTADALATALLVMGENKGFAFASEHRIAAYFIIRGEDNGQFTIKMTPKFAAKIK